MRTERTSEKAVRPSTRGARIAAKPSTRRAPRTTLAAAAPIPAKKPRQGPGRPKKLPGGREEDRAGAIREAAERLFAAKGFDGVSAQEIAAAAGVQKALVFYYFGSKEGLLDAILHGYYERHDAVLRGALAGPGDLAARADRLATAYVTFMAANRVHARLALQEILRGGPHLERIRTSQALLLSRVEEALGAELPKDGPLAARHFFMSLSAVVIHYLIYAEALAPMWGGDPLGERGLAERAEHVRWVVRSWVLGLAARRPRG